MGMVAERLTAEVSDPQEAKDDLETIHQAIVGVIEVAQQGKFDTEAMVAWVNEHNGLITRFLNRDLERTAFENRLEENLKVMTECPGKIDFDKFEDFYDALIAAYEQLGRLVGDLSPEDIAGHEYSHALVWQGNGITPSYRLGFYKESTDNNELSAFASVEVLPQQLKHIDDDTLRELIITSSEAPRFSQRERRNGAKFCRELTTE